MILKTEPCAAKRKEERVRLRQTMLAKRRALEPDARRAASAAAQNALLRSQAWRAARTVFLYCATRNETDTDMLLSAALREGKILLLPKCDPARPGVMRAAPCLALERLVPGKFGILEPADLDDGETRDIPEPDLIVVPGVAFDRFGGRLGYGGGYYDRFIAGLAGSPFLAGLAYAFQVVDALPLEPWDMSVHALCLDAGFFPCPLSGHAAVPHSGDAP